MTEVISSIRSEARRRGITRLCHFTPSRNLGHIVRGHRGVLATHYLEQDEEAVLNPTDLDRFDGYPDHVCCSIQYPNSWYFKDARAKEQVFLDWVVLLIKPYYLWQIGSKFSPRNAAAQHGELVSEGPAAFMSMFAPTIDGAGGHTFTRGPDHPSYLPTDEQAEVLIPDQVHRQDVMAVAVFDDAQAKREVAALRLQDQEPPPMLIVPEFYRPRVLSARLRAGRVPDEREHKEGASDHAEL